MWNPFDTIAAIATPPGAGAVGIIRISGPRALDILDRVWEGPVPALAFEPRRVYLGKIVSLREKSGLDTVLSFFMRAPSSYTGEDVVEVQAHGGKKILDLLLENFFQAGARPAEPGEFSRRAFLNGRMDLAQAEAVADLIQASSARAARAAERQLEGRLSDIVTKFRKDLTVLRSQMEAMLDFPEDEDVQGLRYEEIVERIDRVRASLKGLLATYEEGRFLKDGVRVAILGKPNVGKSSLFNALLKEERSIVHPTPGTTRDVLEETLDLDGLVVRFLDTAGIRSHQDGRAAIDAVESEGVRRSKEKLSKADLVLLVMDASRPIDAEDRAILDLVGDRPALLLYNKSDLAAVWEPDRPGIRVSARTARGLEEVRSSVLAHFLKGTFSGPGNEVVLTNLRHRAALQKGLASLDRVREASLEKKSLEFLVADLSVAMDHLGEVTGEVTRDEILGEIFSKFCIGK